MRDIFVTDLDGTLLRSDQTLSTFTINVLNEAIRKGYVISYATARGLLSAKAVVAAIEWSYPVVLYNGALLYDMKREAVIDGYWLDEYAINIILQIGKEHGVTPFYFLLDTDGQERIHHEPLTTYGMLEFKKGRPQDPRFHEVEALAASANCRSLVLTYIAEQEQLLPFQQAVTAALGEQIHSHMMKDYYIPNQFFLEFSHPLATKKEGLRMWARHMNVDLQHVTIFGDHLNDGGLFEAAGKKLAVSNSHAEILKLADEVIASNNEDGVAKHIEEAVLAQNGGGRC